MKKGILLRILIFLGVYFGLRFFGGEIGYKILYPINLLVTFLHELGHAIGAILTGGSVEEINISKSGAGFTRTRGGNLPIILMGGYLGSALFGNILFLIGAKSPYLSKPLLGLLGAAMIFTGLYWFNSMFTTGFLLLFSLGLFVIVWKTNWSREVLMFLGLASILYIIQDFNIGPSSDLKKYAEEMVILPAKAWMYIWLVVVLVLFYFNIKFIFKNEISEELSYIE